MAMKVFQGGTWRDISKCSVYQGGAWRVVKAIKVYQGGAWRDVANFTAGAGTITLALSPTTISKTGRTSTVNTGNVTATPTGGQTPYTYAWVKQSGDDITALNPANAITAFRATGMAVDETRNAVFRCTATDTFGTSDSEDITVSITCIEPIDTGGTS
jgi:hypothetical protein